MPDDRCAVGHCLWVRGDDDVGVAVLSSQFSMVCLAPAVGEEFVALGRVVKAGRKQVSRAANCSAGDGQRKLVATATTLLVPGQ